MARKLVDAGEVGFSALGWSGEIFSDRESAVAYLVIIVVSCAHDHELSPEDFLLRPINQNFESPFLLIRTPVESLYHVTELHMLVNTVASCNIIEISQD